MTDTLTDIPAAFSIRQNGDLVLNCRSESGKPIALNLTDEIRKEAEKIAGKAVSDHMAKWHGHQI